MRLLVCCFYKLLATGLQILLFAVDSKNVLNKRRSLQQHRPNRDHSYKNWVVLVFANNQVDNLIFREAV